MEDIKVIISDTIYSTSNEEDREYLKEVLNDLGYHKQSKAAIQRLGELEDRAEGEWIKHPASYECTACKEEFFVEGYAEDYDPITDWDLHFCPNCGAKMKGENDEQR